MATQMTKAVGRNKAKPVKRAANGLIADAHKDADVLRMAARELEERAIERHAMIAAAAYVRAQQRGFAPGQELEDWLAAEAEIDNGALAVVVHERSAEASLA